MGKTLLIVESPAKSKTIQKYLGADYLVKASFGHVRDLPTNELGVDLDNNFTPTYIVSDQKKDVVKQLQTLATKADTVLLASDPDREGEAISWHLHYLLKKHCSNIKRITFHEINKKSILEAIKAQRDIDLNMVNSQQARRILDRIVGYQLSPWVSQSLNGKLSAGRVQSVALRIIVDRENEIENFKPEEYWKITAQLTKLTENNPFEAELFQKNNEKIEIKNKDEAQQILNDIQGKPFYVKHIERKEKKRMPAPPFVTSTLQQEGAKRLKWDSSKTMKIAQELYEGVELENGTAEGLITYMRTDSTRINEDFQRTTLEFIKDKFGAKYVPNPPNVYKTKGEAQDAHEAIRPTNVERTPDSIKQFLTADQYALYKLIWERYVASQMAPAIFDTVTVITKADKYSFRSSGYTVVFDGFMNLYAEEADVDAGEEKEEKEKKLPVLSTNEELKALKIDPKQKFTQPPPRFTEASLIKELEKQGIGRPSTYATIVSTLKNREYIKVDKQKFIPTDLGKNIVKLLVQYFPNIMEIKFTAKMEEELDTIAEGKMNWVRVLHDFYTPFAETLKIAKQEVKPARNNLVLSDEVCPTCGKQMAIREGKFGKFLACTGYPDCKTFLPYVDPATVTDIKCELCGKPMIIKTVQKGNKKEKFLGCSGFPNCKNTKPLDKNGNVIEKPKAEMTDKICKSCGKPMLLRQGKNGKFYACSGFPDCKETEIYIDETMKTIPCDKCGKPMILRKVANGYFYGCTGYPNCSNTKPADKNGNIKEDKLTDKMCPTCGKPMVLKEGKTGKFYGCSDYPNCKTTYPYGETKPCPKCNKPMVIRNGKKGKFWGCTGYPTCDHVENI